MVSWNGHEFRGQITRNEDDVLSAFVYANVDFRTIINTLNGVKEVTEYTSEDDKTTYKVSGCLSAKVVSTNTYYIEFSTKLPVTEMLESKIQEQSDAIDELLLIILGE